MKKFIIGLVLDSVFDFLLLALDRVAKRSASKVDDKMVAVIRESREELILEIKRQL